MLDLNTPLGREVPTAQQVLEVIRPQLRMAGALQVGVNTGIRDGWLESTPDLELADSGDDHVQTALFIALVENALSSVGQWAADVTLVFDKARTREFIRQALVEASAHTLPPGSLAY